MVFQFAIQEYAHSQRIDLSFLHFPSIMGIMQNCYVCQNTVRRFSFSTMRILDLFVKRFFPLPHFRAIELPEFRAHPRSNKTTGHIRFQQYR